MDGGGTWTRAVIIRFDGTVGGMGQAGPSNPITIGVERALRNIIEAVDVAGEESDIKQFKSSTLGLAGASRSHLGGELLDLLPGNYGDTKIVSDARAALAGATGCRPGVVVIAGTGSIALGVNVMGQEARAGGWGWRLEDEGSGYAIGRNAITAALKDHDGSGPLTLLKDMILGHLGFGDVEKIIDWAYDPGREPRHFAYMVPLVKEAENLGDSVASSIMEDAGTKLGLVTQAVIRKLGMEDFPIACSGGVFKQPNGYNRAFERTVRETSERCIFVEPMFTPTIGSALLALRSLGVEISDGLLVNVEKSMVV